MGRAGGDVGFMKERERDKFLIVKTWPLRMRQISCTEHLRTPKQRSAD